VIEVEQTVFGYPDGNCFGACVASILELPLDETPSTKGLDGEKWWAIWEKWFAERNTGLVNFGYTKGWQPRGYWLLGAESPRLPGRIHSVVCKGNELIHDPHPERSQGVGAWKETTILYLLDPSLR
jgi:hypothetical protein